MNARFLHCDARLVAVDKPPGVLVIPGRVESAEACLRAQVEAALGAKVFVVHRLDKDTSGLVLFARDAATHRALSMAFERGEVKKTYLALAAGRLEAPRTADAPIAQGRKGRMRIARAGEQGKAAQTRVRALELFAQATLVEAEPLTGRTHQIRLHLAHLGHPLLVDPQYGAAAPCVLAAADGTSVTLTRTPLHAAKLTVPLGEARLTLESPLPEDLAAALAALRLGATPRSAGARG